MNTIKENSKAAFNQQAATYDKDIKGQHAQLPDDGHRHHPIHRGI